MNALFHQQQPRLGALSLMPHAAALLHPPTGPLGSSLLSPSPTMGSRPSTGATENMHPNNNVLAASTATRDTRC